jgi:hypothetical protein
MLINKKFLALALLPIFGACVVNDADDDAAGTDTDVSTTAPTTTSPTTTEPTTTTDPSTTEPTTTTDPATTDPGTESESDTEADTSESETDTGGAGGYCALGCVEPVDCCDAADPNCEPGLGTYPYDWSCDEGACIAGGCTDDEQCTFGGALPTWVCADFGGGFNACAPGCAADADCQGPGTEDYTCTGPDGTCAAPGCTADADCQGVGTEDYTCNVDTGFCEAPPCTSDADCGTLTCDVGSGFCGCTDDKMCGEGFACVTE